MKIKNSFGSTFILTIVVLSICISSVYTTANQPTHPPLFDRLSKRENTWRINVLTGRPYPTPPSGQLNPVPIPVDVNTYVRHGWSSYLWNDMSREQRQEFLKTAIFELTVDGDPVKLHRNQWYGYNEITDSDEMWIIFWIEFKPYAFSAGEHTFEGHWYQEVNGHRLFAIVMNLRLEDKVGAYG